jgi:hypothetical protein
MQSGYKKKYMKVNKHLSIVMTMTSRWRTLKKAGVHCAVARWHHLIQTPVSKQEARQCAVESCEVLWLNPKQQSRALSRNDDIY